MEKVGIVKEALKAAGLSGNEELVGWVNEEQSFCYGGMKLALDEAIAAWSGTLEKVFPTRVTDNKDELDTGIYQADSIYVCKHKVAKPTVFIPVFPGTNCEYDSARAFERAGADTIVKVFKNLNAEDIRDSVEEFTKAIDQAQIIMFPGGFSAGDEPEGSAKFFATAFRNAKMTEAVMKLLNERDGLALGICNGFQALIKLGLVPYGRDPSADCRFADINLQYDRPSYQQDGIHEGCDEQVPVAGTGKDRRGILQSGFPRRGTFCRSEGMAGEAVCKRSGGNTVCQRGGCSDHG